MSENAPGKWGKHPIMTEDAGNDLGPRGAWTATVTFADGRAEPELISFSADGTVTETTSNHGSGIGIGVWKRTGERTFAYSLREQLRDANGAYIGEVHVHARAALDATGDTFEGRGEGVGVSPEGREIFRNATKVRAARIHV